MSPLLQAELREFAGISMAVNYGVEKVRFSAPVPSGASVRLALTLGGVEARSDGSVLLRSTAQIDVSTADRPACVAQTLTILRP